MPLNLGQSSCLSLPLPPPKAGIPGLSHHSQQTNSWLLLTPSLSRTLPLPDGRARQCQRCHSPPASCWGAWGSGLSAPAPLRAHVAPSSRSPCSATATLVESLTRRPTDLRAEWLRVSGPRRLRPCPPGSSLGGSLPPELCSAGAPPLGRQPEGTSGWGTAGSGLRPGSGRRGSGRGHRAGLEHHVSPKSLTRRSRRPLNSDPSVVCCPRRAQPLPASRMLLTR